MYEVMAGDSVLIGLLGNVNQIHSIGVKLDRDGKLSSRKPLIVYNEIGYKYDRSQGGICNGEAEFSVFVAADSQLQLLNVVDRLEELFELNIHPDGSMIQVKEVDEEAWVQDFDSFLKGIIICLTI